MLRNLFVIALIPLYSLVGSCGTHAKVVRNGTALPEVAEQRPATDPTRPPDIQQPPEVQRTPDPQETATPPAPGTRVFFVAKNGNDSWSGRLPAPNADGTDGPFLTIQAAANLMKPGDLCKIREGIYRETVEVTESGTAAAPIVFQSYEGELATVSGADSLDHWVKERENVYSASMTWTLSDGNQIFSAGKMAPEAGWPNQGASYPWPSYSFATTTGFNSKDEGWLADITLPTRPDGYWMGARLNIMAGHGWITRSTAVTAYQNDSKTLTTTLKKTNSIQHDLHAGNEYYLQGKKEELDSPGEWFLDGSKLLFFSTSQPTGVEAKRRPFAFLLDNRSFIKLANLQIFASTIRFNDQSASCTLDGIVARYLDHRSTAMSNPGLNLLGSNHTIRNSELAYSSDAMLSLSGSRKGTIINNWIHDSGYVPHWKGMIVLGGPEHLISHNTLNDAGRSIINGHGIRDIIEYNNIHRGMKLTSDGGLIYVNGEAFGSIVRYNFIHDAHMPANHSGHSADAYYQESKSSNWLVHNNIIGNVDGDCLHINNAVTYFFFMNNTCYNVDSSHLEATPGWFDWQESSRLSSFVYNNIFPSAATYSSVPPATVSQSNLVESNPLFVAPNQNDFRLKEDSPARDAGISIAGITNDHKDTAPDIGALEFGGIDWTKSVGHNFSNPPAELIYSYPDMIFMNRVKDGSFESGNLLDKWQISYGAEAMKLIVGDPWTDARFRVGVRVLVMEKERAELKQVVSGLQAGRTYQFFMGSKRTDANPKVTFGARNFGGEKVELDASTSQKWRMKSLEFTLGSDRTSVELFVSYEPGLNGSKVYVDDLGLLLKPD